jgi:hypothetical protein
MSSRYIARRYGTKGTDSIKPQEAVMKVVQVPEPLWAEMTQPLGHPLGAK